MVKYTVHEDGLDGMFHSLVMSVHPAWAYQVSQIGLKCDEDSLGLSWVLRLS